MFISSVYGGVGGPHVQYVEVSQFRLKDCEITAFWYAAVLCQVELLHVTESVTNDF